MSEGGRVSITLQRRQRYRGGIIEHYRYRSAASDAAGCAGYADQAAAGFSFAGQTLLSGNPPNFEVHTPNAILAARATLFDTSYSEQPRWFGPSGCSQFTDEQTFKGAVGAKNAATPDAAEFVVEAGYETTIACGSPPLPPGPLGVTGIPSSGGGALTVTEPGAAIVTPPPAAGAGGVVVPPIGTSK